MLDAPPNRVPPSARVVASPLLRSAKPAAPCAMVIFGATGDLTKRLVIPALYNLACTKVLPENFVLIGVARAEGSAESWRNELYGALKSFVGNAAGTFDVDHIDESVWNHLVEKMVYVQGDLTKPGLYDKLRGVLEEAEKVHGTPRQRHLLSRGRRSPFWRRGGATRRGKTYGSGYGPERQVPVLAPCRD